MSDKHHAVNVQAVTDHPLESGGTMLGYVLYAKDTAPNLAVCGRTAFQNPFIGLVDDAVCAQIAGRPEGYFVPISMPCQLKNPIWQVNDMRAWTPLDVLVQCWFCGLPGGRGQLMRFDLVSNLEVARNIYMGVDANRGQSPADRYGGECIFGPPYRATVDATTRARMEKYVLCDQTHLGDRMIVGLDLPFVVKDFRSLTDPHALAPSA